MAKEGKELFGLDQEAVSLGFSYLNKQQPECKARICLRTSAIKASIQKQKELADKLEALLCWGALQENMLLSAPCQL